MVSIAALTEHYGQAFTEQQAKIFVEGVVAIEHDLVNREDFSKLTATVERLADRMDGMAAAHERTRHHQLQTPGPRVIVVDTNVIASLRPRPPRVPRRRR